jgi:hypothetical protein
MKIRGTAVIRCGIAVLALGVAGTLGCGWAEAASSCKKIALKGEVNAGQLWQASLGQGWVFRIQPIQPIQAGYSGWDLVVDREQPAGFPDALLLATPPYNSINEREIGTTFGLRAQDVIGWNPRSFHFLIDPAAFRQAQQLYLSLAKDGKLSGSAPTTEAAHDMDLLLQLEKDRASGELRIEDSRLTPGVADPAPFAQAWALTAMRSPHQEVAAPDGKPSPRGALAWMRFSVTLSLPASWKLPAELHGVPSPCVP